MASFKAILYPYVEGRNGVEAKLSKDQWVQFGAAIKRLHSTDIPSSITKYVPREMFPSKWRETVKAFLVRLEFNAPNAYNTIDQKLFEFNKLCVPATQKPEVINLNFTIKNDDEVIAGLCADVYIWQILYLSVFFVEKNYRHQGLGAILLNKVEEKAKQLGATLAHLDTFDFQAKDFYIKYGYEVFGILDKCPKGHKRYYMKKVL